VPYGPWQCRETIQFSFGASPLVAAPCHALGSRVQMKATVAAYGGSADVTVEVRDASGGRTVAGPIRCSGLAFGDRQMTRDCGPRSVGLPHGRTYVVAVGWSYTKDGRTVTGSAKGTPFGW
jgi:hypothetical protein